LFAVRVILDTEDSNDCFAVYGTITDIYLPNPDRFKNYISVPKKNGYQSIHTTVVGPEGKMVEVQIRTRGMHEVAERGVAAHWMYKENAKAIDEELSNWVNWVREIFENAEQVPTAQLMESFKLNLYQDEIYLFTPKGELKILPTGATPVDFAYEIHSKIGQHCLAAKVNGRIVPLDSVLKSGDQVEILTSKNQTPNPDWEKFVVTHKAKSHIRRWVREEQRKAMDAGKELWEKKTRKAKLSINEDELQAHLKFINKAGEEEVPLCIHRAPLGTHERMLGFLIEQYAGNFPVWLAPEQVRLVPVTDPQNEYAQAIVQQLRQAGIRASADVSAQRMNAKIRAAQLLKVPYMLVVGESEMKAGTISLRVRDGSQQRDMALADFIARVRGRILDRSPEL